MVQIVYFSSTSENTKRFVDKLDQPAIRIPMLRTEPMVTADSPFVLVTPTYGAGKDSGAVPKQVIQFLNNAGNRTHLVGVIGGGNTNFGRAYCLAADIIAEKCGVPVLYRFEILGTPEDVDNVKIRLETL